MPGDTDDLRSGNGFEEDADPISGFSDSADVNPSVVLISPNYPHRRTLRSSLESQRANLLGEFNAYPGYAHLPGILEVNADAYLIEIDSDIEVALELVEAISNRKPTTTVMVYSSVAESESMMRAMRAGAREYLSGSLSPVVLQEALVRAAARRVEQSAKKDVGKLFVFWGAKGGCGVTTLAANFAIGLRLETSAEVALLDLNPQLGDVAVLLGMSPRFTVAEALGNSKRLDQEFVSTLLTEHSSGISVLAAPDSYSSHVRAESRTVGKLADVIRNQYEYVVVDAGRELGDAAEPLFEMASSVYLVTQLDVPSLRNAQRFLSHLKRDGRDHIEVAVNRFEGRRTEFDDERVAKVLGVKPKWRIPNDYPAVYRSSNAGTPLVFEKSPAAQALRTMARAASGKPVAGENRKRGWSMLRLS